LFFPNIPIGRSGFAAGWGSGICAGREQVKAA
jgi:hypothetical protein